MASTSPMIAGVALTERPRKSRLPARLDWLQSASGLVLALFMWGHMFFVSSILVSEDFMWRVTKMFEGYFLLGKAYPGIESVVVFGILVVFLAHAFLAVRKLPINFLQWAAYRGHMKVMKHEDTTLWWVQAVTGFMLDTGRTYWAKNEQNPEDEADPLSDSVKRVIPFVNDHRNALLLEPASKLET